MINLTTGNEGLTKVKALKSSKTWGNLAVRNLPAADQRNLLAVVNTAFNEELTLEDNVISIKFEDRAFKASYAPSLYATPEGDGICVKFGNKIFTFKDDFGGADVSIQSVKLDKYEDPAFVIELEVEDDVYISLPLPLRLTKEAYGDNFNEAQARGWVKKGQLNKLAAILMVAKVGSSSNDTPMVAIADLPEETNIKITAVKEVNVSYGKSYILTITHPETGEAAQMWAHYSIKELLSAGAEVGPDSTFQFINYTNRKGDLRQSVTVDGLVFPEVEGGADIALDMFL